MMQEVKILIDAIGSVLDSHDRPLPISELVSMLNDGYLEYIGLDPIESVSVDDVDQCVKRNEDLFDNYFGVISLKNQKYKNIDEIEKKLKEFIKNSADRSIIDFILFYLLFLRYDAIQNQFDLKKLSTSQLNFRTYGEPNRLDSSVITKLINQFYSLYSFDSYDEDFVFHNEDLINHSLDGLTKIVKRIDWRSGKLSSRLFEELIVRLYKLNRFNYRGNAIIPHELSEFIQSLLDGQNANKITESHSFFADFIPFPKNVAAAKAEVEIIAEDKLRLIQSGLRVVLKGYSNVRLQSTVFSSQQKKESDILISFPPFGNLSKSFWAEKFEGIKVDISSLEELYTRDALLRLNETGKAYLILPENFLSGNRKSVSKLREDLTNKGWIDTIVKLPHSWFLSHNVSSLNLVILDLNGTDSTYFFDMSEFQIQNKGDNNFLVSARELIKERISVKNIARSADTSSILGLNSELSVHKYINPIHYDDDFKREKSEKIVKLADFTQQIRSTRHEVTNEYPFINMSELADDASNFVLDLNSAPKKQTYSNRRPLLKENALLIGTIGGVLKPTIFQYKETPIFLGSNVIALRVDKGVVDVEYLISELNSKFVADQIKRLPTGTTIPNIKKTDLLNIAIRVPDKYEQTVIFNKWISSIAKEKIKEIEGLHESIKYIEKEVFSSFAHDFGKILLKVSSNIDVLTNYLKGLDEKEIINLQDSVFFEKTASSGQTVNDVITRLQSNQVIAQEFLQDEVQFYTGEAIKEIEEINLNQLISEWIKRQETTNFTILTGDMFSPLEETDRNFGLSYIAKGNKSDILSVLNNFLNNAVEHGFTDSNKQYQFVIYMQLGFTNHGNIHRSIMHIGNNGKPFPKDFTCKDFFTFRHKGPESNGSGKGGYSIKRRLDNMGATINCESNALPKDKYPVQFEIFFKHVTL